MESETHYRLLTEDASDVVWKVDSEYRFTYISPADERLRGYRSDEVTDVSELPQLGKLKFFVDPANIIASVATFPTSKGERISVKIYKPPQKLTELALDKEKLDFITGCLNRPGIIFVCGSALSGKTSVIYSLLSSLKGKNKNIMTIESIIKYNLAGINQCELNEKAGFDFDKALKFIDFQSPDVIYFEEIFDNNGFDFILRLAKSGKVVLSEFMASDVQILVNKIRDLEIPKSLISCIIFVHNRNKIEILSE